MIYVALLQCSTIAIRKKFSLAKQSRISRSIKDGSRFLGLFRKGKPILQQIPATDLDI